MARMPSGGVFNSEADDLPELRDAGARRWVTISLALCFVLVISGIVYFSLFQ